MLSGRLRCRELLLFAVLASVVVAWAFDHNGLVREAMIAKGHLNSSRTYRDLLFKQLLAMKNKYEPDRVSPGFDISGLDLQEQSSESRSNEDITVVVDLAISRMHRDFLESRVISMMKKYEPERIGVDFDFNISRPDRDVQSITSEAVVQ